MDSTGMSDASSSTYMEDEALLSADTPVGDQDLLRTFKKVLASGVNMIQHGATGPAVQIHLCLRKNVLYWSGESKNEREKKVKTAANVHASMQNST